MNSEKMRLQAMQYAKDEAEKTRFMLRRSEDSTHIEKQIEFAYRAGWIEGGIELIIELRKEAQPLQPTPLMPIAQGWVP